MKISKDLLALAASEWESLLSHLYQTLSCPTFLTRSSHSNFCLLLSPCFKHWVSPSWIKHLLVLPKDFVLSANLTSYNSIPPFSFACCLVFPNQAVSQCDGAHGCQCNTPQGQVALQGTYEGCCPGVASSCLHNFSLGTVHPVPTHYSSTDNFVRLLVPAFALCSQCKQEHRLSLNRDVIQSRSLSRVPLEEVCGRGHNCNLSAIGRGMWSWPQLQLFCYWKRYVATATLVKYLLAWV